MQQRSGEPWKAKNNEQSETVSEWQAAAAVRIFGGSATAAKTRAQRPLPLAGASEAPGTDAQETLFGIENVPSVSHPSKKPGTINQGEGKAQP